MPGWKVKSAGTESYARVSVTEELLVWADRIFTMEERHSMAIVEKYPSCNDKITVLGIEDVYNKNNAKLVATLITKMAEVVDLDEWVRARI